MKLFAGASILLVSIFLGFYLLFNSISPEGIDVLTHYIFGNGEPLELESSYLPNSPVIVENLEFMKIGETKKVGFYQEQDWRLSYALNGFHLTKEDYGFRIYQKTEFDSTGKVYTIINLYITEIKVYDNWVNLLNCTPYDLTYKYDSRTKIKSNPRKTRPRKL